MKHISIYVSFSIWCSYLARCTWKFGFGWHLYYKVSFCFCNVPCFININVLLLRCANQLLQDAVECKGPIRTCEHVNLAFDEIIKRHTANSRLLKCFMPKGKRWYCSTKNLVFMLSVSQTIIQESVQSLYSATHRKQRGGAPCPGLGSNRKMMMRTCSIPVQSITTGKVRIKTTSTSLHCIS